MGRLALLIVSLLLAGCASPGPDGGDGRVIVRNSAGVDADVMVSIINPSIQQLEFEQLWEGIPAGETREKVHGLGGEFIVNASVWSANIKGVVRNETRLDLTDRDVEVVATSAGTLEIRLAPKD